MRHAPIGRQRKRSIRHPLDADREAMLRSHVSIVVTLMSSLTCRVRARLRCELPRRTFIPLHKQEQCHWQSCVFALIRGRRSRYLPFRMSDSAAVCPQADTLYCFAGARLPCAAPDLLDVIILSREVLQAAGHSRCGTSQSNLAPHHRNGRLHCRPALPLQLAHADGSGAIAATA